MKLFFLRHTKLDCLQGTCYGQSDVQVAQSFEEEKNKIATKLGGICFNKVFSSPLNRCASLVKSLGYDEKDVVFDKLLMELNFGDWEGKLWSEIENTDEAKLWFDDYLNISCPNGESYQDLINRVQKFITDLNSCNVHDNILIVTHAGVIRAFHAILNNVSPYKAFELKIDYGQIIEMDKM